jgi:hypothetical protein
MKPTPVTNCILSLLALCVDWYLHLMCFCETVDLSTE